MSILIRPLVSLLQMCFSNFETENHLVYCMEHGKNRSRFVNLRKDTQIRTMMLSSGYKMSSLNGLESKDVNSNPLVACIAPSSLE